MSDYVLFTDSTADLPQHLVEQLEIAVIPLLFELDGQSYYNYPDNHELDPKVFYDGLRNGKNSTTSQINAVTFEETFSPFLEQGKDILYLCFSSGLSGTYQSSQLAMEELTQKYPQRTIRVVDTLCASMGEGLIVYLAAKMKQDGKSLEEVAQWTENNKQHLCQWFTVDDLMFLKRGGRVSSTAAVFGTMLGIKPVLHVDSEGHLIPMQKVRGRKASLDALVQRMVDTATAPKNSTVFISHGDCEQDAQYVAEQIRQKLHVQDIVINFIGPVIGSHSGPGTVALFFIGTQR